VVKTFTTIIVNFLRFLLYYRVSIVRWEFVNISRKIARIKVKILSSDRVFVILLAKKERSIHEYEYES